MVFCRECGKEVQEDWITCPYCSHQTDNTGVTYNISDSVITGDLITEISSIPSLNCPNCNAVSSEIIACSVCDELTYCAVCSFEKVHRGDRARIIFRPIIGFIIKGNGSLPDAYNKNKDRLDTLREKRLCDTCFLNELEGLSNTHFDGLFDECINHERNGTW